MEQGRAEKGFCGYRDISQGNSQNGGIEKLHKIAVINAEEKGGNEYGNAVSVRLKKVENGASEHKFLKYGRYHRQHYK